jgi:hypothetical protein
MPTLAARLHLALASAAARRRARGRGELGQSTVEYARVILAAAGLALLVVAWAASTGRIGALFDSVVDSVTSRVA